MKRIAGTLLLALAAAAPLATFAITVKQNGDDQFKGVAVGQTRQQVRALLGAPSSTTRRGGETRYVYNFLDAWGMRSVFDVTFDSTGRVEKTAELRVAY